MMTNNEGMKRVQSLIKRWLNCVEELPEFKELPPETINLIRKSIMRSSWGAFKVGLLSELSESKNG